MNLFEELQHILTPEQVTKNETLLEQHSKDESYHTPSLPDIVVFPENAEEVSEIMKLAKKHKSVVVPFGLGSSLEGNVIPYDHGLMIDFSHMNQVAKGVEDDFLVKLQNGVTRRPLR